MSFGKNPVTRDIKRLEFTYSSADGFQTFESRPRHIDEIFQGWDSYEYIAVYVHHLAICMKDPQAFCVGHLARLKKIIGYLANLPHGSLRFRTHELDYSNRPHMEYDWQRTVYPGAKKFPMISLNEKGNM